MWLYGVPDDDNRINDYYISLATASKFTRDLEDIILLSECNGVHIYKGLTAFKSK